MAPDLAERGVVQALAYVATAALVRSGASLEPFPPVATGWRVQALHARPYARLNLYLGEAVQHLLRDPATPPDPDALARTEAAEAAAGYPMDQVLWQPGLAVVGLISADGVTAS
ncbi:hypothetical protein ACFYVL_40340 [Streptomyces sp. NPDC004111]|uniref:hypothetical protein n=1 Tax=Streptomyces sp. NPDC004111 TaxID=3364690 RepID=UPI0036AA6DAD